MHTFRSIDRSLHPTGRMPWIILRLWGFLFVREARRTGTRITVWPFNSCLLSRHLHVQSTSRFTCPYFTGSEIWFSSKCPFWVFWKLRFNEITCSSRTLRGYLIDRQLTLINTKASSISWKSTALSCKECKDEQVTMTTWFNKTRSQVFER